MDALPMMVGQGFGAYARAISRDRWRLYKVEERLREVNIGGTAIVTALVNHIGYDKATQIAKKAVKQTKTIRQIVLEEKILPEGLVDKILNPYEITKPGIPGM